MASKLLFVDRDRHISLLVDVRDDVDEVVAAAGLLESLTCDEVEAIKEDMERLRQIIREGG